MEKLFKLRERGTDVRTEVLAGFVTLMAMAYSIFVSPATLSKTGEVGFGAVATGICLAAGITSMLIVRLLDQVLQLVKRAAGLGSTPSPAFSSALG